MLVELQHLVIKIHQGGVSLGVGIAFFAKKANQIAQQRATINRHLADLSQRFQQGRHKFLVVVGESHQFFHLRRVEEHWRIV